MDKFKRKLITLGSMGIVIASGLNYNLFKKSDDMVNNEPRKEMIAMYVQDEEGNYQTSNPKEFPKEGYVLNIEKSTCKNGGVLSQDPTTKAISLKVSHADACNLYFEKVTPKIKIGDVTLNTKLTKPNFAIPATTDETADGLYAMEDDYGTSYYFRGAVKNNFVKFGQLFRGEEMWWRIIRINGDGSMRIQYDGIVYSGQLCIDNELYCRIPASKSMWNDYGDDAKYIGYMYGGANGSASSSRIEAQKNETDSTIKQALEAWITTTTINHSDYIADNIFCNDRSTPGKALTGDSADTGLGYGMNYTLYGVKARIPNYYDSGITTPQFKCPQNNDKFTVSAENGNGALTYPVGLITADELIATGMATEQSSNPNHFLYHEDPYWSFTPSHLELSGAINYFGGYIGSEKDFYPVINIKAEYVSQMKGTGTIEDPFIL